jgi:endoglycosylceramidase
MGNSGFESWLKHVDCFLNTTPVRTFYTFLLIIFCFALFGQPANEIYDIYGRTVIVHGLNTSGCAKNIPGHQPWITEPDVIREDSMFGFSGVRYLIFWGAIEPQQGVYDEAYLKQVKEKVEWYTKRHMYVILDMHQDIFGYGTGGNGAPEWASANTVIKNLIPDKWPWWMQNLEPKVKKSYVQFFKYKRRKLLQDHYLLCWQKVAAMFRDNPYVLGYDLMNEPHGGLIIKTLAGGFERRQLSAFYKRMISGIRSVDTVHYIVVEPRSFGVNFGMKSHLPGIKDEGAAVSKLIYAPHCYMMFVDVGGDYNDKYRKSLQTWFKRRESETLKHNAPMLIGEFGLSPKKKDFDKYLQDIFTGAEKDHASWTYWSNDFGSWSPLNADRTATPILGQLISIYPKATAGKLLTYSYHYSDKSFEMQFVNNASIKMPTEIAVPREMFPNGVNVQVDGASHYMQTVSAASNSILLFVEDDRAVVHVKITSR